MKEFKLPDLGEGLPDAEIVEWHVKEGDLIEVDAPLVSMETAKAVVDVPSPYTGKIMKLHGQKGDVIITGHNLVSFEDLTQTEKKDTGTVVGKVEVGSTVVQEKATNVSGRGGVKVLPAVRALAKKLNVDLSMVNPSGANGTITKKDVEQTAAKLSNVGPFEPLKGTRRTMANIMTQSHQEVVPVSIFDDADITDWEEKDYTVRVLRAISVACQKEPALNAWFDGKNIGRCLFSECHIGLAMDTADGLFVPVIENVQAKDADAIREEVNSLKTAVKDRSITPEKLSGHTITLSNFGNFAGRYASPIVVPPTVAIIGTGKVREEVIPVNHDPATRTIMPLSITFDHRAVTGGEATRFLGILIEELSQSR